MEYIIIGSHQKDLAFALSGWETLDLFDYERSKSHALIEYDPATFEIRINKKGLYKFEFFGQMETDTEEMIQIDFRLNIDTVPHDRVHSMNTGMDQKFTQVISVDVSAVVLIEVNATPNSGSPVISNTGNDFLLITKMI